MRPATTALLASVLLLGCPLPPPAPPPVDDSDPTDCAAACDTLAELGCETLASAGEDEVIGTADDSSCVAVCTGFVHNGMPLRPRCISKASSCAQVEESCLDPGP